MISPKMTLRVRKVSCIFILLLFAVMGECISQPDPSLILTKEGMVEIHSGLGKAPLFDRTLEQLVLKVDREISNGIEVPVPKDLAGGYTHERHKSNFFLLQEAGVLFQVTGDEKYARFIKEMLFAYKDLYPGLGLHPEERSYSRGKLFWQCLNDANWLVYVSQAYDCIYLWLDQAEREALNNGLFRPMADFLSIETPRFFNRIHNHSTWGNAAVGMIGLVMNDAELVDRALYGAKEVAMITKAEDNDGGMITSEEGDMGFLAQIDHAFSPDGYYTEGPYYQRYAMYPFLIFAQALHNKRPDLDIFNYKDGVLIKGAYALLNQTNSEGEFFPINDAQKGMSYKSRELTTAVNIAYYYSTQDPALLSVAQIQDRVALDQTGMQTALAITKGESRPFTKQSMELRDGADGDEGAIGILRSKSKNNEMCLVMKYSKHGMGHGHFDKLSFCYYLNDREVLQDYGAARWVNIALKDGGGYLKENKSWAKQTIAHNTVVLDRKSQFDGKVSEADLHHPEPYLFDVSDRNVQVMSAKDTNSYRGVELHRTMVLINSDQFENPVVLDLFRVKSREKHDMDLPFYFNGHLMKTNFEMTAEKTLEPMGEKHGYQHLWTEARGKSKGDLARASWFDGDTFYSLTTVVDSHDELVFGLLGANDPLFNLRRDQVFMIRKAQTDQALFASVIEVHGSYSYVNERPENTESSIEGLRVLYQDDSYSVVRFSGTDGGEWTFALANRDRSDGTLHKIKTGKEKLEWQGAFSITFDK